VALRIIKERYGFFLKVLNWSLELEQTAVWGARFSWSIFQEMKGYGRFVKRN
jgi:hypothetical protein